MLDSGGEYSSGAECFVDLNLNGMMTKKKKNSGKNKRRFSDDQIRSLETMFESETRLEPRKKLQLARELGLQPRQVAIWFQNKRARWKSKQLERDYAILLSSYNTLASQFEALSKERQSMLLQLQKLNEMVGRKTEEETQCCNKPEQAGNSMDRESDKNGDNNKSAIGSQKPTLSLDRSEHGVGCVLSDDDSSIRADYFGLDEETELLNMVETADGCLTSPENWGNLDSDDLLNQQTGSSSTQQWWDFWS